MSSAFRGVFQSVKSAGRSAAKRNTRFFSNADGEAKLKHTPYGMQGSGFYSEATKGCFQVFARLRPEVLKACEEMLERRRIGKDFTTPFRIFDLGTADAGTSLPLIRECVAMIRGASQTMPIEIIYEDQPGNDWQSVFART